jgi:hypothetical protein
MRRFETAGFASRSVPATFGAFVPAGRRTATRCFSPSIAWAIQEATPNFSREWPRGLSDSAFAIIFALRKNTLQMRDPRERIVVSSGRRYYWYAGPFKDVIDAHDYLAAMLARSEISDADADDATIIDNSIFLRMSE